MPRETIGSSVDPYCVKVGWATNQEVQVGVERADEGSMLWLLFNDHAALGEQVRKMANLKYDDDEHLGRELLNTLDLLSFNQYAGLWSTLDRQGCNRLIRIVRKARDAAFGRDE